MACGRAAPCARRDLHGGRPRPGSPRRPGPDAELEVAPEVPAEVPAAGAYYVQSATTGLNAADSAGAIVQHNPKGNEDHQQWTPVAVSGGYQLQNADESNACLGRSGTSARRERPSRDERAARVDLGRD